MNDGRAREPERTEVDVLVVDQCERRNTKHGRRHRCGTRGEHGGYRPLTADQPAEFRSSGRQGRDLAGRSAGRARADGHEVDAALPDEILRDAVAADGDENAPPATLELGREWEKVLRLGWIVDVDPEGASRRAMPLDAHRHEGLRKAPRGLVYSPS